MTHTTRTFITTVLLAVGSGMASGQASPTSSVDPAIARAQQRAAAGDSAAARMLLDSLQASKLDNEASRAEVDYWLARLAASPADRELGLTTLVVDHPFSPRVGPALFELGMLELSHGDRERAAVNLSRFLATTATDSNRTSASLALGKLLLDLGETSRACAVLLSGRSDVPQTAVELRNQFDYAVSPCRGVDTSAVRPAVDTTPKTSQSVGEFTVQVAAYASKAQADRLATRLRGQGLEARVIGKKRPFRVRVGHYMTHAEAYAALKKIDAVAKLSSFVVMIGPEEM